MNSARIIYHLARADFLERVRRYSFLVMLGLVVFLGYQIAIGTITLKLGNYRGEYNSAWVGALMSLNATFFIGWFGFYLVKGAVARDRDTGVGQIMATTPLTRSLYMLGKWLSNFAVLMSMVVVLALAGIVIQLWTGESAQIDLLVFLEPFFYIVLPLMGLVAAVAVLFEAIPFLRGSFGNLVYFFVFIIAMPLMLENVTGDYLAFEPTGIGILYQDMGAAVQAAYPAYDGGFSFGSTSDEIIGVFTWNGAGWTANIILGRLALLFFAFLITLLAALLFDRFDPSRARPRSKKVKTSRAGASTPEQPLDNASLSPTALPAVYLTPLTASARRFSFFRVLVAELKLLLKGQRWWWYVVAGGLIIAGLASPPKEARAIVLSIAWVWPILIWSRLGNMEIRTNVYQMVFSSAAPLWRQLPASWLAGFLVAVVTGSGVAIKLLAVGDGVGLLAWFSGAVFIPSLALAFGVWSNSSKLFEVVYILLWYAGPMNSAPGADYLGANSNGYVGFFFPLSILLIVAAFVGRARQLRS